MILTTDGVGGGPGKEEEEEVQQNNDIEYIIMNLYSKMKNLENKYIDLANFYKQELVKGNPGPQRSSPIRQSLEQSVSVMWSNGDDVAGERGGGRGEEDH